MVVDKECRYCSLLALFICAVFLFTPCFFACDDDDDNDGPISFDAYFPLDQGNRWDFIVRTEDTQGTGQAEVLANADFGSYSAIPVELRDTSEQGLGSGKVYLAVYSTKAEILGGTYGEDILILDNPFNILLFPLSLGNSWNSLTIVTIEGINITITAETLVVSQETIVVEGRTYSDCFKLTSNINATVTIVIPITVDIPVTAWLASGVGPVKIQAEIPANPLFPDVPSGPVTLSVTGTNF